MKLSILYLATSIAGRVLTSNLDVGCPMNRPAIAPLRCLNIIVETFFDKVFRVDVHKELVF